MTGAIEQKQRNSIARTLRQNITEAEQKLWLALRSRRLGSLKFRRQHRIGPYIVDFVCLEGRLVVEVDGGQHAESTQDINRDAWLQKEGYTVLRFWNHDVLGNLDGVLEALGTALERQSSCKRPHHPHPSPLPSRERGDSRPVMHNVHDRGLQDTSPTETQ